MEQLFRAGIHADDRLAGCSMDTIKLIQEMIIFKESSSKLTIIINLEASSL